MEIETSDGETPWGLAKDLYGQLAARLCSPKSLPAPLSKEDGSLISEDAPIENRSPCGLVTYTQSTARDGTHSETLDIHDQELAKQFLDRVAANLVATPRRTP
jgi:hypothetical protein